MIQIENLPETMKNEGRFCLWKFEKDEKTGRPLKVPYNPETLKRGKSDDPKTFTNFAAASSVYKYHSDKFEGIGIRIAGRIGAIDIDHCFDDDGTFSLEAADVLDAVPGYIEKSPSGEGVHIFFITPENFGYDKDEFYTNNHTLNISPRLEFYMPGMTNRFMTLTGDTLTPEKDLEQVGVAGLRHVLNKYMRRPQPKNVNTAPPVPLDLTDAEILAKIQASGNAKFDALWSGDINGYDSQSEADEALCEILAFWTGRDPERVDNLFRQSGLYREKWNRESYGAKTIAKAIAIAPDYDPDYYKKNPDKANKATKTADKRAETNSGTEYPTEGTKGESGPCETSEGEEMTSELAEKIAEYGPDMGPLINEIYSDRYRPIATGIAKLDDFLGGGLIRQTLVLLGARPGAGKTILCQMIAESFAKQGVDVVYLCLEMSKSQLLGRSLARIIHTDLNYDTNLVKILQGYNHDPEMKKYVDTAARIYAADIGPHIQYNPFKSDGLDVADLTTILQRLDELGKHAKAEGKCGPIVVLDYLHLLSGDPNRKEEQSEIIKRAVQGLKNYAIKYNTIAIAIEAQNREANKSDKALLEGGRDSSNLEYSGDLCLSLVTGKQEDPANGDPDKVTLYVVKSRFTAFDIDSGLEFKKHGGQSYFEQVGQWTNVPINQKTPFTKSKENYSDITVK